MKIEFLYFEGCPNHKQALDNLKKTLNELGLEERIEVFNVHDNDDAITKRFLGSPSIRIDGNDLELTGEADTGYSMRCRRYKSVSGAMVGYPDPELIRAALQATLENGTNRV